MICPDLTNGSTLHAGIFIAVLMILVVHILMTRTTLRFELKAVGMNKFASNLCRHEHERQ